MRRRAQRVGSENSLLLLWNRGALRAARNWRAAPHGTGERACLPQSRFGRRWRQLNGAKPKARSGRPIAAIGESESYAELSGTRGCRNTIQSGETNPKRHRQDSRAEIAGHGGGIRSGPAARARPTDGHLGGFDITYGSVGERSSESDDATGSVLHAAIVLSNGPTHLGQRGGPFSSRPGK